MIQIAPLTLILSGISIFSTMFAVFSYFRNPQIRSDQEGIKLADRMSSVEKSVIEIREKHLTSIEGDIKNLDTTIQKLSETVVRLSTIIDERIPKAIQPQLNK